MYGHESKFISTESNSIYDLYTTDILFCNAVNTWHGLFLLNIFMHNQWNKNQVIYSKRLRITKFITSKSHETDPQNSNVSLLPSALVGKRRGVTFTGVPQHIFKGYYKF